MDPLVQKGKKIVKIIFYITNFAYKYRSMKTFAYELTICVHIN